MQQVVREEYYGADGEPISKDGYYDVEYDRNEDGEIVAPRYYDDQNKETLAEAAG